MKYFTLKSSEGLFGYIGERCSYLYLKNHFNEIKMQKARFRKLATDFSLKPWERYNLMMECYDFDRHQLFVEEKERVKKQYPNNATIKTEFVHENFRNLAQLKLRVANGIKLSKFKVYSVEEVNALFNSGSVKFVSSMPYGRIKKEEQLWEGEDFPLLAEEFGQPVITEEEFELMAKSNPISIASIFEEINCGGEILKDYEMQFLPQYKEHLKHLAKLGDKVKSEQQDELSRLMREQQQMEQDLDDAEILLKQISDATKGR